MSDDRSAFRVPASAVDFAIELLTARIDGLAEAQRVKIEAMERALQVANDELNRVPTRLQIAIGQVRELMDERQEHAKAMARAQNGFVTDLMARTDTTFAARLSALDATLGALRNEWQAGHNDLKDRVIKVETIRVASRDDRTDLARNINSIGVIFGIVGFFASLILGIVAWHSQSDAQTAQAAAVAARAAVQQGASTR